MDKIRLATPEEIQALPRNAELIPPVTVVAFDNSESGKPDFAVIRTALEIDPVYYAEDSSDRRKLMFQWGLETALRVQGVPMYYFNLNASDEKWLGIVEKFGAERQSSEPEIRFRKFL